MANAGVELNLPVSRGKVQYAEPSGSGEGVKGALEVEVYAEGVCSVLFTCHHYR